MQLAKMTRFKTGLGVTFSGFDQLWFADLRRTTNRAWHEQRNDSTVTVGDIRRKRSFTQWRIQGGGPIRPWPPYRGLRGGLAPPPLDGGERYKLIKVEI